MTSEMAIYNQNGLVLAADSALTFSIAGRPVNTLNSATKLFAIDKSHYVGIMIYNNATFMGISWQVIINSFKDYIKDEPQDTLDDYVQTFIKYVESMNIYTEASQIKMIQEYAILLRDGLHIPTSDEPSEIQIVVKSIMRYKNRFDTEGLLNIDKDKFVSEFKPWIVKVFREKYGRHYQNLEKLFVDTVYDYVCSSEMIAKTFTGIIFAGYGVKDLFPSVEQLSFDGTYLNTIKYRKEWTRTADPFGKDHSEASIIPVGQLDTAYSILNGIGQDLDDLRLEEINQLEIELKNDANLYLEDQDDIKSFEKAVSSLLIQNNKEFNQLVKQNYTEPFVDMIQTLSIQEMGEIAETLVSATAFKRKYSGDLRTSGGPIDILAISRSDGVRWLNNTNKI